MRKLIVVAIGLAVLIITPYFLLPFVHDDFHYGEAELRAAIEGSWQLALPDRDPIALTLTEARAPVQQHSSRGFVRPAAACAHRTLVRSAEACLDTTEMELAVTVRPVVADASGHFVVVDTTFRKGELELNLGDLYVVAHVAPDGTSDDVYVSQRGPSAPAHKLAGATLVRVAR